MSSGSTEKELRYVFPFSLKSSSKRTPTGSPTGPLWRELHVYKAFFNVFPKFHIKIPLNNFIPSVKDPRRGASLHVLQKRGTYGNRRPFPELYLSYLLGSPVKEPSLQVPLIELPRREMPHS
jgi:hypothetical protein